MPFKVFSLQLPFVRRGNLITDCEVEEVGGGAVGETHD